MGTLRVTTFYCSGKETAAIRRLLGPKVTLTAFDEGGELTCDFAVIGANASGRHAVLSALREKLGGVPAVILDADSH